MKKTMIAMAVMALLTICIGAFALPGKSDLSGKHTYALSGSDGNVIRMVVNAETGQVGVVLSKGGSSVGYRGVLDKGSNTVALYKSGTYGSPADQGDAMRLQIKSVDAGGARVKLTKVKDEVVNASWDAQDGMYMLEDPEFAGGDDGTVYHCHNSTGTGFCDIVNTDAQWWRCFRCCIVGSC